MRHGGWRLDGPQGWVLGKVTWPMTAAPGTTFGSKPPVAPVQGLARHALTVLIDQATRARGFRPGVHPVVLVSLEAGATGRWLDALEQAVAAGGASVRRWHASEIAARITAAESAAGFSSLRQAFTAPRLAIVQTLEQLGSAGSQQAFARLLDAAACSGTAVCITLRAAPGAGGFAPELESRLMAGLVAPVPATRQAPQPTPGSRPTCGRVVRVTAAHCGIPVAEVVGTCRQRSVVHARSLAMYLARRLTGKSLDALGRTFGGRDHSTVLRGVRATADRAREDPAFAADIERLVNSILGGRQRRRPR